MTHSQRRDNLAALCSIDELDRRMPQTIGAIRDELIRRRIIPTDRAQLACYRSYADADLARLRCFIRYEYADEMMSVARSSLSTT